MAGKLNVADLIVRLLGDTTQFQTAMSRAGQRMTALGSQMKAVGGMMTAFVTVPIVGVGVAAARAATKFETSMSKIVGLVGIQREQVQAWEKDIKALAPTVGKTANELGEAMFFIVSAGARGKTALDILEASAKAASAGLGETKDVAFAAVSAMNAYGEANLSAQRAASIMVATVREGNLEAAELAPALGRILPIASALGVSFDQVGAAVAAMTRLGIDSRMAIIAYRQVLLTLMKPTKEARDTLAQFGMSAEGLRKELREKGTLDVLLTLRDRFKDNEEAMNKVFGNARAIMGVLNLVGANAEKAEEIFGSLAKSVNDAEVAFDVAADTAGFKLQQSLANINVALIKLGDEILPQLVPMIESFADKVAQLGQWFSNLEGWQKKAIIGMAAFAAVIGPVLFIVGSFVGMIGGLLGMIGGGAGLAGVLPAASGALGAMGITVSGTALAVGGLHGALIAAVAALSYFTTKEALDVLGFYDWFQEKVIGAADAEKDWTDALAGNKTWIERLNDGLVDLKWKLGLVDEAMVRNQDTFTQNRMLLEKFKDQLKLTGEEFDVGWERNAESAAKLASALEKAREIARGYVEEQRKAREATEGTTVSTKSLADRHKEVLALLKASDAERKKAAEETRKELGLLTAPQVQAALEAMNLQWHDMLESGVHQNLLLDARESQFKDLIEKAKLYNVALPQGTKEMADAFAKASPEIKKTLEELPKVYFVNQSQANRQALEDMKATFGKMTDIGEAEWSGGFGRIAETADQTFTSVAAIAEAKLSGGFGRAADAASEAFGTIVVEMERKGVTIPVHWAPDPLEVPGGGGSGTEGGIP